MKAKKNFCPLLFAHKIVKMYQTLLLCMPMPSSFFFVASRHTLQRYLIKLEGKASKCWCFKEKNVSVIHHIRERSREHEREDVGGTKNERKNVEVSDKTCCNLNLTHATR